MEQLSNYCQAEYGKPFKTIKIVKIISSRRNPAQRLFKICINCYIFILMESLLISAMKSEPVPVTCYLSQILYLQRVVTGSSVGCFTASPHTAEDLPNTVRCSGQKYHCILLKLSPTRFVRPDSMQLIANAPVPWLSGICVSRAQTGNVFADTMISRFTNPLFSCRVPGIFIVMP